MQQEGLMTAQEILRRVCGSLDVLMDAADEAGGLFPSVLDMGTHRMPDTLPPPIQGQRKGDRSYPGSNLMHDVPTLHAMYGLSAAMGDSGYAQAADRYLKRFAEHCAVTASGLFPWGEHAFWDLRQDRVNPDPIHDHLRQAPVWLWEKLWEFRPECVIRFAEGLDCHWTEGEPLEYCRHASIETTNHASRHQERSCDFARHAGFYVFDWAFAYARTGRADFLAQIRRMTDYWWPHRSDTGLLLSETRSPERAHDLYNVDAPAQTLSLGVSLIEAAELIAGIESDLANVMRERGRAYIEGFLSAPHDLDRGVYVLACRRGTGEVVYTSPVWGSVYGIFSAAYVALLCLRGYRLTTNHRLLEWASSVADRYAAEALPEQVPVPAIDAGLALGLLADLHDVTRDIARLEQAMLLARVLARIYLDCSLVRGAAGIDWYESQMGPGYLLHALARTALLAERGADCPLDADYTAR